MAKRKPDHPSSSKSSAWGRVEIKEDPGNEPLVRFNRALEGVTSQIYIWQPNKSLQRSKQVLDSFYVGLRCEVAPKGERRFSPIGRGDRSLDPFLFFYARAFACGLALICKTSKMTKRERQSYRAMYFLFQRAQKMRQHIRRVFNSRQDLIVAKSGRKSKDTSETHILPWEFNSVTRVAGYPQSVAELLERGAEAARKAGVRSPSASQRIHYGLAEAARIDPKPLNPEVALRVIKSVLFDIDVNAEPLPPEIAAIVEERVLTTIWPHLDDETAVFNDWFWGRHNTFVKQVAQQKKRPGGELEPEIVEQYLLEKGWEAYEYVGHCVRAWAHDFLEAIPEPLTRSERSAFALLYFCLPKFGKVPLVLLAEKLHFVSPLLEEIVSQPSSDRPVQVLYRLLQFYTSMVPARRRADVAIKNTVGEIHKWLEKKPGQTRSADTGPELMEKATTDSRLEDCDQVKAIYTRVATAKNITCDCSEPDWDAIPEELEETHEFRIKFCCRKCGEKREAVLPVKELKDIESRLK